MYSDSPATKDTLLKILTLDEYAQYNLLVTLISYSDDGDVKCHFERTPIREIMKKDSKYQKDIKSIRTAVPDLHLAGAEDGDGEGEGRRTDRDHRPHRRLRQRPVAHLRGVRR